MKKGIHPDYHPVVFVDSATSDEILTRSTIISDEKREIEGVTHYVVYCDITSFTHPFYTCLLYTLTLPTILRVSISVVAVSIHKQI